MKGDNLNGKAEFYYENGNIQSIENYENGIEQGKFELYDTNGKLTEIQTWEKGVMVKSEKK